MIPLLRIGETRLSHVLTFSSYPWGKDNKKTKNKTKQVKVIRVCKVTMRLVRCKDCTCVFCRINFYFYFLMTKAKFFFYCQSSYSSLAFFSTHTLKMWIFSSFIVGMHTFHFLVSHLFIASMCRCMYIHTQKDWSIFSNFNTKCNFCK